MFNRNSLLVGVVIATSAANALNNGIGRLPVLGYNSKWPYTAYLDSQPQPSVSVECFPGEDLPSETNPAAPTLNQSITVRYQ